MTREREYILGTHDDEISRLALQHRVWRPRALDAWQRTGFSCGQTLLDIGCGPGYASIDLAEIVGPSGRVFGVDRSRRFLATLETARERHGIDHLSTVELDLDVEELPMEEADGAWSRWVFAFLKHPRELLARIGASLKQGGILVIHEYFDYSTWRLAPRLPEIEEFVSIVMMSWRADGGEPDIALDLPTWLEQLGFEMKSLRPIIDVVPVSNFIWQWPRSFVEVNLRRLVDLGHVAHDRASSIW